MLLLNSNIAECYYNKNGKLYAKKAAEILAHNLPTVQSSKKYGLSNPKTMKLVKLFENISANWSLIGNKIKLPFPSVGATENIIMAASLARGESEIRNIAVEPEVTDLIDCLNKMGAKIRIRRK